MTNKEIQTLKILAKFAKEVSADFTDLQNAYYEIGGTYSHDDFAKSSRIIHLFNLIRYMGNEEKLEWRDFGEIPSFNDGE